MDPLGSDNAQAQHCEAPGWNGVPCFSCQKYNVHRCIKI